MYLQKVKRKKTWQKNNFLSSWRSLTKIAGSGSGSVSQIRSRIRIRSEMSLIPNTSNSDDRSFNSLIISTSTVLLWIRNCNLFNTTGLAFLKIRIQRLNNVNSIKGSFEEKKSFFVLRDLIRMQNDHGESGSRSNPIYKLQNHCELLHPKLYMPYSSMFCNSPDSVLRSDHSCWLLLK